MARGNGGAKRNGFASFLKSNWWLFVIVGGLVVAFVWFGGSIKKLIDKLFNAGSGVVDTATDLLAKAGIGKSDGEKSFDELSKQADGYWNPNYVKAAPAGAKLLTYAAKKEFAKTLYDAWGFFAKDFDGTLAVFRQLSAKSQVSDLAAQFYEDYKKDLLSFLRPATWTFSFRNYPSSDQFLAITNYTNALKPY